MKLEKSIHWYFDLLLVFFGVTSATLWIQKALSDKNILPYLEDDASYYTKIAYFISRGQGYTFDGVHYTNGFHPLLAWLLVPFNWINSNPVFIGQVLLIICVLFYVFSILAMRRLASRLIPGAYLSIFLVLSLLLFEEFTWSTLFSGMETSIMFFCLLVFWIKIFDSLSDPNPLSPKRAALLGGIAMLVFTARLDTGTLHVTAGFLILLMARKVQFKSVAIGLGTFLPLPLIHAAYCYTRLGTIVPVSGLAKKWSSTSTCTASIETVLKFTSMPQFLNFKTSISKILGRLTEAISSTSSSNIYESIYGISPAIALLSSLIFWVGFIIVIWRAAKVFSHKHDARSGTILGVGLTAAVAPVFHFFNYSCGFVPGYYDFATSPIWLLCIVAFLVKSEDWQVNFDKTLKILTSKRGACLVGIAVLFFLKFYVTQQGHIAYEMSREGYQYNIEIAQWLNKNTTPQDRIGGFDAGLFGYVSGRTVINLDGRVNDYTFAKRIRDKLPLGDYVEDEGISYLTNRFLCEHLFDLPMKKHKLELVFEKPVELPYCIRVYKITRLE